MRFTLRPGTDPIAEADGTLLRALGMPSGGFVSVGRSHVAVRPGSVNGSDLRIGPLAMANAGCSVGNSVDVRRALPPGAARVQVDVLPLTSPQLVTALHGRILTVGDRVELSPGAGDLIAIQVLALVPGTCGTVGPATVFSTDVIADVSAPPQSPAAPSASPSPTPPTSSSRPEVATPTPAERRRDALLTGLDTEIDVLTGWFSMLASDRKLEEAWSLPSVAGIVIEGPVGCGKAELVAEAARRAGTPIHEVDTSVVFKADRLLDLLSAAVNEADGPRVIFVDRIDSLAGTTTPSIIGTQAVTVLRWFIDAVSSRPQVMCVLGVERAGDIDRSIARSPLLPRILTVPPPDLRRRELLFEAALADVPRGELDAGRLAALSSGFSGADILAAVLHAVAGVAANDGSLDTDDVAHAIRETPPSLGSVPLGEATSFGFDKVANLVEVKQRLIEAVVWPMRDPERFARLGIDPPRGILLYGPPGTGKTFVVKALAHEAGAAFFSVKGAELLDKFVGESERGVRDVFSRARAASPSIIFFDEFDALAPVRGKSTNSVTDSVVAALLTEIDGVSARGQVSVIAATNRRDLIDPALLRAGRFETHLLLELPGTESRRALLDISDVPLADDVDLDELAELTEGLSFADITGVLREAALVALRADDAAMTVHRQHVLDALERVRVGRDEDPIPPS